MTRTGHLVYHQGTTNLAGFPSQLHNNRSIHATYAVLDPHLCWHFAAAGRL